MRLVRLRRMYPPWEEEGAIQLLRELQAVVVRRLLLRPLHPKHLLKAHKDHTQRKLPTHLIPMRCRNRCISPLLPPKPHAHNPPTPSLAARHKLLPTNHTRWHKACTYTAPNSLTSNSVILLTRVMDERGGWMRDKLLSCLPVGSRRVWRPWMIGGLEHQEDREV